MRAEQTLKIFQNICISFRPNREDSNISMKRLNYINIIWWNTVFSVLSKDMLFQTSLFSPCSWRTQQKYDHPSCKFFGVSLAVMTPLGEFCSYFSSPSFNGFSQGPIKSQHFSCCLPLPYSEDNVCHYPISKMNTQHAVCARICRHMHTHYTLIFSLWTGFCKNFTSNFVNFRIYDIR